MPRIAPHILRDLQQKCADDVVGAILRSADLTKPEPMDSLEIFEVGAGAAAQGLQHIIAHFIKDEELASQLALTLIGRYLGIKPGGVQLAEFIKQMAQLRKRTP